MSDRKRVEFNGQEYIQTANRYYFCVLPGRKRKGAKQLHKAVWEFYNQRDVPDGYHVHHIDFNRDNNDISNLVVLPAKEHLSLHGKRNFSRPEYAQKIYATLDTIRDSTKEWHGSAEGKEWHRQHTLESLGKAWEKRFERICIQCGTVFMTSHEDALYCCQKCGNRYRKGFGKTYTKECVVCGKEYQTKLPKKAKFCSSKCRGIAATKTWKNIHPES